MGASMKQYLVEGMRSVWQQLNELARSHRSGDMAREEPDTPTGRSWLRGIALVSRLHFSLSPGSSSGAREGARGREPEQRPQDRLRPAGEADREAERVPLRPQQPPELLVSGRADLGGWMITIPPPPPFSSLRRSEDTALFILKEVYEESNPVLIKT